ncbi:UNVERIFIED_CONTAM: hypothetical protein Scaly_1919600 [Sesamum calycinum]|uniref:RNase H type-1 domain-containing protein n=1 Tax=Sesamum calycinum TaxID=2727403 RepID=A0AAW2NFH0_9LAMI
MKPCSLKKMTKNGCYMQIALPPLRPTGTRVVLTSSEGNELAYALRFDFNTSKNEAEYKAFIAQIRMALGARNLIAYFDSQLVTNKVECVYKVKEDRMKEYLQEINKHTSQLRIFQLHQILRTENTKADYLARVASSLIDCSTRTIIIRTLIKDPLKTDVTIVLIGTDWRTLFLDNLKEGVLPADETKVTRLRNRTTRFALLDGILYKS